MLFSPRRSALLSLGISTATYVIAIASLGAVTAHAVWRVGAGMLQHVASDAAPHGRSVAKAPAGPAVMTVVATGPQSVRHDGEMTPLADRSDPRRSVYGRQPPRPSGFAVQQFGTSARNPYRPYGQRPYGWDDDEERPPAPATYRTVCVRLCDGYYFPVSFAVTPDRLERDRDVCESRCGAQGRLFVQQGVGGLAEDMVDLQGRAYRQLRTAFLYRTEYVPSCKCQPEPWEAASQDRHRAYALAASARKGSKEAAKELQALQTKVREAAKAVQAAAVPARGTSGAPDPAAAARQAEIARREDGGIMRLGSETAPKAKAEPFRASRDPDWIKRTFDPSAGR